MSIIRLIHIKVDPGDIAQAERVWKTECAPLMIRQHGCMSEKLLRGREDGEFISYSEWSTESDIDRYKSSPDHAEIVRHTRGLKDAKAEARLYDVVE
jgi:heme-degrading monooxygenase HmoA